MGFFDFISDLDHYSHSPGAVARLNNRRRFLIEAFATDIEGASVLDLASHDGRWCYAFAGAGAASVFGVEARGELIDRFRHFPDAALRAKVTLKQNDLYAELEDHVARGETYDVIGVFGILYHVMDHHRLLLLLKALSPKLIIVDGEFLVDKRPIIRLTRERTDKALNAVAHYAGQEIATAGIPSFRAMEVMAETLGYSLSWSDWKQLPSKERNGVKDYYRRKDMRRATCSLRCHLRKGLTCSTQSA